MNDFLRSTGYASWILPALLLIPAVGAIIIWVHGAMAKRAATDVEDEVLSGAATVPRAVALLTFAAEFIVSLGLWWSMDPKAGGWSSYIDVPWIPSWGIRFTVGLDGIAVMMVLLTTFIMLLSVL